MKAEIAKSLPLHRLLPYNYENIHVIDHKPSTKGTVVLLQKEAIDGTKSVHIHNPKRIRVCFDGFTENALPVSPGVSCSQCECVIFPDRDYADDWILFIETKYVDDLKAFVREARRYPNKMIDQILKTVQYFRDNGIIHPQKKVHAILSLPKIIENFSSAIFTTVPPRHYVDNYNVLFRPTNKGTIISEQHILLH